MRAAAVDRTERAAVLAALVYLLAVAAVAGLEHVSESEKLDRGVYTDTFEHAGLPQLVTLPLSLRADDGLPTYPDEFDAPVYRDVVEVRLRAFLFAGVVQAVALGLLVAGGLHLRRRWPSGRLAQPLQTQLGGKVLLAGAYSRSSAFCTRRWTTGSLGAWSCSMRSAGHLSWIRRSVTRSCGPDRYWLWYGVTTSSYLVTILV